MTADEYRRLALEAQNQAARAADPVMKAGFERIAQHWLALADQVQWQDQRYGSLVSRSGQAGSGTLVVQQQQQQVQPKKDDDKKD